MTILIILMILLVAAMVLMAGFVAILEIAWPFLVALGFLGLIITLLDRYGILPEKKKKRPRNRRKSKK